MKYALGDVRVRTEGEDYWVAPNAVVIGDVRLGKNASIWWNCVVRGDSETITIGENVNVQDGSVLHVSYDTFPLRIGEGVVIGHAAVVHGCTIEDGALIGIGARVLDGAVVERGAQIAGELNMRDTTAPAPTSASASTSETASETASDARRDAA